MTSCSSARTVIPVRLGQAVPLPVTPINPQSAAPPGVHGHLSGHSGENRKIYAAVAGFAAPNIPTTANSQAAGESAGTMDSRPASEHRLALGDRRLLSAPRSRSLSRPDTEYAVASDDEQKLAAPSNVRLMNHSPDRSRGRCREADGARERRDFGKVVAITYRASGDLEQRSPRHENAVGSRNRSCRTRRPREPWDLPVSPFSLSPRRAAGGSDTLAVGFHSITGAQTADDATAKDRNAKDKRVFSLEGEVHKQQSEAMGLSSLRACVEPAPSSSILRRKARPVGTATALNSIPKHRRCRLKGSWRGQRLRGGRADFRLGASEARRMDPVLPGGL